MFFRRRLGVSFGWVAANWGAIIFSRSRSQPLMAFLSRRRAIWLSAALGILFASPSIWTGYIQDDHFFRVIFKDRAGLLGVERSPFDSFVFSAGPSETPQLKAEGILPWWTAPDWQLKFSRPVASLSHYADFAVFGDNPIPMHIHNLVLLGVLLAVAGLLFRHLMKGHRTAAGLATLMYALDACHGIPAGWISHRNSMYAELFGLLALLAHHEARKAEVSPNALKRTGYAIAAVATFGLSLLSGEIGITVLGYFISHALFLDATAMKPGAWQPVQLTRRCAAALWPYVLAIGVWRTYYDMGNYGADGSGFYVDPMRDPALFLAHLFEYFPILFMALYTGPDSMLYMGWHGTLKWAHYLLGLLIVLAVVGALIPRLRHSTQARFWITGSVLSVIPLCAAMPTDRLLVIPALGSMGIISLFIVGTATRACWIPRTGFLRSVVIAMAPILLIIHVVISPFVLTVNAMSMALMGRMLDSVNASVDIDAFDGAKRVILLDTPLDIMASSFPIFAVAEYGRNTPGWTYLHAGVEGVRVDRIDDKTLALHANEGFFTRPWSMLFGNPWRYPLPLNEPFSDGAFDATITETETSLGATTVQFHFHEPLDSDTYLWLSYENGKYVPFDLPDIGASSWTAGVDRETLERQARHLWVSPKLKSAPSPTGAEHGPR